MKHKNAQPGQLLRYVLIVGLIIMLALFFGLLLSYPLSWHKNNVSRVGRLLKDNPYIIPLITSAISSSLVILTFTIDRIIAGGIRKRDARRSWYSKAFIDPNLKEIRTFFSELNTDYKAAIKTLKRSQKYLSEDNEDYTLLKAQQTELLSAKVRQLDLELVSVILVTHPDMALKLQTILEELRNYYTEGIDLLDEDYTTIQNRFGQWQGKMMGILAEPLSR